MQVAKWGNSLAIRIPSAVVDTLELKEGDDIVVRVADDRSFEIGRHYTHRKALERIKSSRLKLPTGWSFEPDEANSR